MGGGGGGYFPSRPGRLQDLITQTQEDTAQKRLESDVNAHLQKLLVKLNERDPDKIKAYINEVDGVLGKEKEIETFLFGGSVAKHTFVDGLSDIDALVVLSRADLEGKAPAEVLESFLTSLTAGLTRDKIASIEQGKLAVTVNYRDGTEIQLLPALRRGKEICIADATGNDWKPINPKPFQRELSKANDRLNNTLVPVIKLIKSVLSGLPDDIRPTGYHIESLSVEATKGYRGPKTVKSLLLHVLAAASNLVLHPIVDVTSQSKTVDAYLGRRNSDEREKLSHAIAGISRRINAASTVDRWKEIIGG